jgi:hypothetical protein
MQGSILRAIYESNCASLRAQEHSCSWKVSGAVSRFVNKGKQAAYKVLLPHFLHGFPAENSKLDFGRLSF